MSELMHEPWQVESLRFTVFSDRLVDAAQVEAWWGGVAPDGAIQDISRRLQEGVTYVTGSRGDSRLDLQVQADRIDWIMHKGAPLLPEGNDAFLGVLSEVFPDFVAMMEAWIRAVDLPAVRLAFGGVVRRPVEDETNVYSQIAEKLPFINFQPGWSDFNFQVNNPDRFVADGIDVKINVLRRYCVELVRGIRFDAISGAGSNVIAQRFLSRIDFDVNTDADISVPFESVVVDRLVSAMSERV